MYKRKSNILAAAHILVISMGVTSSGVFAGGFLDVDFEEVTFSHPLIIDNPYWPLRPDESFTPRTFTYIGETDDECVVGQITVDDTMYGPTYLLTGAAPYNGNTAVQVLDTEWVFEDVDDCNVDLLIPDLPDHDPDSAIKEKTLDWYMQDDQKNIWYVGEYSQGFEDDCADYPFDPTGGAFPAVPDECKEGSWEAGISGGVGEDAVIGEAGIVVPGDFPLDGEPLKTGTYYMQEVAFEAEDMAKILKQHASLSVEDGVDPGEYEDCRKTKEWTALEPGASVENKWYCKDGPGLVLIKGVGGGPSELEVLVSIDPVLP